MSGLPVIVHTVTAKGQASGPPVLLIHGFASNGATDWPDDAWAHSLSDAGRDVLVVDLPGHGQSVPVAEAAPTSAILDALAAVVSTAGGTVDVVSYSLGSRLAWDLARRPDVQVRRAVFGGLSAAEPFGAVDVAAARAALAGGTAPEDPLTAMILGMASAPGNDPHSLLQIVEGLRAEPFLPSAEAPAVPVLVVSGESDPMGEGLEGLTALMPDARLVRVPGDHVGALRSAQFRERAQEHLGL